MRSYVMHFASRSAFCRAFERLIDSDDVAGCVVEPDMCRLRFLAPEACADTLVQRIYLDGGLISCRRG